MAGPDLPSPLGPKYFTRCAAWDWRSDDEAVVFPVEGPPINLDKWQTFVFESADSGRTAQKFLDWVRVRFPEFPPDVDRIIDASLRRLAHDLGVVVLTDAPARLPYYFDLPKSRQDPAEARRAMQEDGLIPRD